MTETATLDTAPQPQPGLFARFLGIITSPKTTFEAVVRKPNSVAILAVVALLIGGARLGPTFSERGRQAQLDFQVQQMERMGFPVSDEMYTAMEKSQSSAMARVFTLLSIFITIPLFYVLIPGAILYAVFNAIMGGTAQFKQVGAILAHSSVLPALGALFAAAVSMAKGSMTASAANVGMLLPMLPENSFAATFAGTLDVFGLWYIVTLSIGLGVLYRRKAGNIAIGLFSVFLIIVVGWSYFVSSRG